MKNKISDTEILRHRIYHKDKSTNEIGFLEMEQPSILFDEIDNYLKLNNKSFMYCTEIGGPQKKLPLRPLRVSN